MTRKDYALIAAALAAAKPTTEKDDTVFDAGWEGGRASAWNAVVFSVALALKNANANFNVERFRAAAGAE